MKRYRIRCLDDDGRTARVQEILCPDDLAALNLGERLCDESPMEIWFGSRLVARVKPFNAPLTANDRQSL